MLAFFKHSVHPSSKVLNPPSVRLCNYLQFIRIYSRLFYYCIISFLSTIERFNFETQSGRYLIVVSGTACSSELKEKQTTSYISIIVVVKFYDPFVRGIDQLIASSDFRKAANGRAVCRHSGNRTPCINGPRAPREGPFFVRGALTSTDRRTRGRRLRLPLVGCFVWLGAWPRCQATVKSSLSLFLSLCTNPRNSSRLARTIRSPTWCIVLSETPDRRELAAT